MNWTDLLEREMEEAYDATQGLFDLVNDDELEWKPGTGSNWMTTGQLLRHLTIACGAPCMGYVTGDWGLPEGMSFDDVFPDARLPTAEEMPSVTSVAEARRDLAADKKLALAMVARAGEDAGPRSAGLRSRDPFADQTAVPRRRPGRHRSPRSSPQRI